MGLDIKVCRITDVVNAVCFVLVVVVAAVFLLKPFEAVHRGLFCDDETIRYPFREDTISVTVLILTAFLPVAVLVFILEVLYGVQTVRSGNAKDGLTDGKTRRDGFKRGLLHAGLVIASLILGNCLCYILTEVFKISFGRLRPSFLSACQPAVDVTSFPNCTGLYIEDITCQNPDIDRMIDMRKSFVSGHASFALFNMLFIILYFELRLPSSTPRLVAPVLQSVALGYGIYVCATRIHDNFHHPQDVLGGVILGIVTSWVTVFKICPRFVRHHPRTELEMLPITVNTKQGISPSTSPTQTKE